MTADPLERLFDPDDIPGVGGYAVPHGTPAHDVAERIQAVVMELSGLARFGDLRVYATALHALATDLCDATGAPRTGRRHPAHLRFVDQINERYADGAQ